VSPRITDRIIDSMVRGTGFAMRAGFPETAIQLTSFLEIPSKLGRDFDHGGSGNQRGRDTGRFAGVRLVSLSAARNRGRWTAAMG